MLPSPLPLVYDYDHGFTASVDRPAASDLADHRTARKRPAAALSHTYDHPQHLALAGEYRSAPRAAGGSQRIFRPVEPDELADLVGSGQYRNIPGIGDGKTWLSALTDRAMPCFRSISKV